jgi:hypothetical protein
LTLLLTLKAVIKIRASLKRLKTAGGRNPLSGFSEIVLSSRTDYDDAQ